jgi:23S rRNA G2069 N7-methylase RlmK/C1962 C5-methylase RlmI
VYSNAVGQIDGTPKSGEYVEVVDENGGPIGRGFYNSKSLYRVRLLASKSDKYFTFNPDALIFKRIEDAIKMRLCLGLPSADTNAYRFIK